MTSLYKCFVEIFYSMVNISLLKQEYLNKIKKDLKKFKSGSKTYSIGLIGLPGSGKTYFARLLSKKLSLYIANADEVRLFLTKKEIKDPLQQRIAEIICEARTVFLYKNKINFILDTDLINFYEKAKKYAKENNAEIFIIKLKCSEKLIFERIKLRDKGIDPTNPSPASFDKYFERKEQHYKKQKIDVFYEIDTSKKLELQIKKLIKKIRKQINLNSSI